MIECLAPQNLNWKVSVSNLLWMQNVLCRSEIITCGIPSAEPFSEDGRAMTNRPSEREFTFALITRLQYRIIRIWLYVWLRMTTFNKRTFWWTLILNFLYRIVLASCLIYANLPSADDNSLIGCTSHDSTDDWSQPVPISLTAGADFAARLGAFFYRTRYLVRQYHSDLSDQSAQEIRVRNGIRVRLKDALF